MRDVTQRPTLVYELVPSRFAASLDGAPLVAIRNKLDHFAALGVDALCLTPVFPADDALGREAVDFDTVATELGTVDDFEALCHAAAARGIAVIVSAQFHAIGARHPWVRRAAADEASEAAVPLAQRRRAFFRPTTGPIARPAPAADVRPPVELDLEAPNVRRALFTGEKSVALSWLRRGACGWRLLDADRVGIPALRELGRGVLSHERGSLLIGDIRGFADRYVRLGAVDGVVNHYLRVALASYVRGNIPARQLARVMHDLRERYDRGALDLSWSVTSGPECPRMDAVLNDPDRTRIATVLKYTLPGATHIYYGEEVGLGDLADDPLAPMVWHEAQWDPAVLDLHRTLGRLRRRMPALKRGAFVDLTPAGEEEILAFARVTSDPLETAIVVVNRASQTRVRTLFAPVSDLPDGLVLEDVLGGGTARMACGSLRIEVGARAARVLCPRPDEAPA